MMGRDILKESVYSGSNPCVFSLDSMQLIRVVSTGNPVVTLTYLLTLEGSPIGYITDFSVR